MTLIRDENAKMVWAVEQTVRLPTGEARRGSEVAAEVLVQRQRLFPPPPLDAPVAYQAMTTVPQNWIPFIPVHVPGDTRSIQLLSAHQGYRPWRGSSGLAFNLLID